MQDKFTAKQIIPPLVSLALFMESLDATIINTAIPTMARNLHVGPIDLKLALISYLLSLAIFIPISGWLADRYGTRRIFISALSIFTLSSIACGMATNLPFLIFARLIQGFGGALMSPVGRLIIVNLFDRSELLKVMNKVITIMLIGPALGPVLGGYIVHYFSWRWIFLVNIPFGILAIILSYIWLENLSKTESKPFDIAGFLLFGISAAALTFGLSALSESFFSITLALLCIGLSLFGFAGYYFHSRHQAFPILPLHLFAWRTFKIATVGNMAFRFGQGAMTFAIPLLLQIGLGYSPLQAGLLMVPVALGAASGKTFIQSLLRRLGYKKWLILNGILFGLTITAYTFVNQQTSFILLILLGLIYGVWVSTLLSSMNSLFYADIPKEANSKASSFFSTIQQLFQSFGVAIGAVLLKYFAYDHTQNHGLHVHAFQQTFLIMGIFTILCSLVFCALKTEDAQHMLEKR